MTIKLDLFDAAAGVGVVVAVGGLAFWHPAAAVVAVGVGIVAAALWGAKRYGSPDRPAERRPDGAGGPAGGDA